MLAMSPVFRLILVLLGALMAAAAPLPGLSRISAYVGWQVPPPGTYVEAYAGRDCAGTPTVAYYLENVSPVRNLGPALSVRSSPGEDAVLVAMFDGKDATGAQVGSIQGRHCANTSGASVQSVKLVN